MANMSLKKNEMPSQDAKVRQSNFSEVALGYTKEMAIDEAQRCLNCKNMPCVKGCPVEIKIPAFIKEIAEGNFDSAYDIISESSALPAICGRVCPQESQCEKYCVRAIKGESVGIGRLERFVADLHNEKEQTETKKAETNGYKVAVIGSGPSGLTCAGDLAKMGYDVTVFEALHIAGGVLSYGIPEFRLPKSIVKKEIEGLAALGVKIETNVVVGRSVLIDELLNEEGFSAVYVATGAGLPKFMGIPGEQFKGVCSANEFLTRVNLMKAYKSGSYTPVKNPKHTVVVGGGNVAMDAARCARRLGSEVTVVYRRTEKELPARLEEIEHAKEEGIKFCFLTNPTEIIGDENGFAKEVKCQLMRLGEPDSSGRARPVAIEGSEKTVEADCVIMSLGTSPNPIIKDTTEGLDTTRWGGIVADEISGQTSREGVFAGGDAVTGAATVILAMGAGKNAAKAIDLYIKGKK